MPIPIIDFENQSEKEKHDQIASLQAKMNKLYTDLSKADNRSRITLKRQFDAMVLEMNDLLKILFDLGEFSIFLIVLLYSTIIYHLFN